NDSMHEAIEAAERAMRLAPRETVWAESFALLQLETGNLEATDSIIRDWSRPRNEHALAGLDLKALLLRERGQYDRAAKISAQVLSLAKDYSDSAGSRLLLASSLARSVEFVAAARVFEQAARHPGSGDGTASLPLSPSAEARSFVW